MKPTSSPVTNDRSAGVPAAVAGASRPRFGEVKVRDRGRLPHWEKDNAIYFITFRLADSLPKSVLERIESERQAIVKTAIGLRRDLSADERTRVARLSTPVIERFLDSGAGACDLHADTPQRFLDENYDIGSTDLKDHGHISLDKAKAGNLGAEFIDHIAKVAGIDHVGLGSDFDGVSGATPDGIDSAADLPKITQALLDRGYSADDIRKSLGGNVLRAFREAERVSPRNANDEIEIEVERRAARPSPVRL